MSQRQALDKQIKNSTEKVLKFEDLLKEVVVKLLNERDYLKQLAEENAAKISEMERKSVATQLESTQRDATIKALEERLRIAQTENCQSKMMAEFGYCLATKLTDDKERSSSLGNSSVTGTPVPSNPVSMETLPADESGQNDEMNGDGGEMPKNLEVGNEVVVVDLREDDISDDENANKSNDSLGMIDPLVSEKFKN